MARLFQVIPRRSNISPASSLSPSGATNAPDARAAEGNSANRSWHFLLSCLLLACLAAATRASDQTQTLAPKPAALRISGYGFLGNHELKRILQTLELAGKKPEFFSPSFVEDATLILASRIKRDGYL